MNLVKRWDYWKNPTILLIAVGISNIGAWIYLIALNLTVLQLTEGSALAVAGLYIIKPIATLFTNTWSGSVIDRLNKRTIMIFLDLVRALLIGILPFFSSLWMIYLIVFVLGMAGSIFTPTSMSYITQLLIPEQRKKFNAIRSLISSGSFLLGPAVAGLLFAIGSPSSAIYINAIAMFISGLLTFMLPNLEDKKLKEEHLNKISIKLMKEDWGIVKSFSKKNIYIMLVYMSFIGLMVMATALDSLEAAFSTEVLGLTEKSYGFLVSIAGGGIVAGSLILVLFSSRISVAYLMGFGAIFVSVGYIIYSFSTNFFMASIGFFVLSFALAFINTGFQTFYQNNIPIDIMGRIGSIYGLIQAFLIIIVTVLFGVTAEISALRNIIILGSFIMLLINIGLCTLTMLPTKSRYYNEPVNN
ncbi:MFS transporter [Rossellomorea vietnamensis]|uniref:MFS transporter n=1 Tax=Rossellomorea vietnamensis TaxID=218284 RepID=A0A5D4NI40_9BACI|nr:MFS transporter [Rossellomorea vietnamensis]TYS12996.1 MFS transporter [Rossellomorea vietnamensis]